MGSTFSYTVLMGNTIRYRWITAFLIAALPHLKKYMLIDLILFIVYSELLRRRAPQYMLPLAT